MVSLFKYFFVICLVSFATANAQNPIPLFPCCDNGLAQDKSYQADSGFVSVVNIDNNCNGDIPVTPRQCVDRTRDSRICGGASGSKYCHEVRNVEYPRYYALYHPMIISPSSMTFKVAYGIGNPSPQTFSITNGVWSAFQLDNTLNWSANRTQNWLTVSPSSGTVSGTTPASITVSINVNGLAPGMYSDIITVSATQVSNRQNESIQITLDILSASISGPTYLNVNQAGTFAAAGSGGTAPYSYQWYAMVAGSGGSASPLTVSPDRPAPGNWYAIGTNSPTVSHSDISDFEIKCVITDARNNTATSNIIYVTVGGSANFFAKNPIGDRAVAEMMPEETSLNQNYPNPFNPSTQILFALAKPARVILAVYDMLGRKVAQLADEQMDSGYHAVTWNADKVSSGVYIYRLSTENFVQVRRMVVMK